MSSGLDSNEAAIPPLYLIRVECKFVEALQKKVEKNTFIFNQSGM